MSLHPFQREIPCCRADGCSLLASAVGFMPCQGLIKEQGKASRDRAEGRKGEGKRRGDRQESKKGQEEKKFMLLTAQPDNARRIWWAGIWLGGGQSISVAEVKRLFLARTHEQAAVCLVSIRLPQYPDLAQCTSKMLKRHIHLYTLTVSSRVCTQDDFTIIAPMRHRRLRGRVQEALRSVRAPEPSPRQPRRDHR